MEYKISEVVAKTNVPKSTILYYIKEGLLPQAKKIKANVHTYGDEHVELIKYIRYMKEEMRSSNTQIKTALSQKNNSFSSSYSMLAPLMQTLSSIPSDALYYTKEEFIEHFGVDRELFNRLLEDEILLPLHDKYTQKEASIITLVENFLEVGIEYEILKEYLRHAKELARLESSMQEQLCSIRDENNFSTLWKIMFETLFTAKEYIFQRSTYKALLISIKEELVK